MTCVTFLTSKITLMFREIQQKTPHTTRLKHHPYLAPDFCFSVNKHLKASVTRIGKQALPSIESESKRSEYTPCTFFN